MKNIRFHELPENERPAEKARRLGTGALTDRELLAVLLRQGTRKRDVLSLAQALLDIGGKGEGLPGLLHTGYDELLEIEGVGEVRAVQLLALAELSRRMWRQSAGASASPGFLQPGDCARYYMQEMRHLEQEQLRLVFLDGRMKMIRDRVLTVGSVDSSIVPVRELMIEALRNRAVNIILLHNHPSGDPFPSPEDRTVTKKVSEAGNLVGIRLADHIIIGDNTYYSFKEWGLL